MYARAAPRDWASAAWKDNDDAKSASSETGQPPLSPPKTSSSATNGPASFIHQQPVTQEQQRHNMTSRPPPSHDDVSTSSESSLDSSTAPVSGRVVEKLARKLSKQDLHHPNHVEEQFEFRRPAQQKRQRSSSPQSSSESVTEEQEQEKRKTYEPRGVLPSPPSMPSLRSFRSWTGPALGSPERRDLPSSLARPSYRNFSRPWTHVPPVPFDQPIEVDEAYLNPPTGSGAAGPIEVDEGYGGLQSEDPIEIDEEYVALPGEPIEVDESYIASAAPEKPAGDRRVRDVKRIRRKPSGPLKRSRSSTRLLDPRVQGFIENEEQCTVRSAAPSSGSSGISKITTTTPAQQPTQQQQEQPPLPPLPAPTMTPRPSTATTTSSQPPTTPSTSTTITITGIIEPDPTFSMPTPDGEYLVPDDVDNDATFDPESNAAHIRSLLARGITDLGSDALSQRSRDPATGGLMRKYTVGGVSLRYRASIDAALRCQTVVRNRPRMRKRHKYSGDKSDKGSEVGSCRWSVCSESVAGSVVHSPVVGPTSSPPPLPPVRSERMLPPPLDGR